MCLLTSASWSFFYAVRIRVSPTNEQIFIYYKHNLIAYLMLASNSCRMKEIRETFDTFDANHDGIVSTQEARAAMLKMGFKQSQIDTMVAACDKNKDGYLQYEEFVNFWLIKWNTNFILITYS